MVTMKIFSILLVCSSAFMAISATAIIDPHLQKRFLPGMGGSDTQNVMVSFTQGIQQVFQQFANKQFSSPSEKRTAMSDAQQTFTNAAQAPLKAMLNTMGVQYESFWINNKMIVPNVDSRIVNAMSHIPGVAKIEKEPVVNLNIPFVGEAEDFGANSNRAARQSNMTLQWGVKKIRADQVWQKATGRGVVVAGIDTGVRWTHEILRDGWRREFGWYDPYMRSGAPNDNNGHGTHTMGTIVGTSGYGVAPGATWIACKGCTNTGCNAQALMGCGQWVQCPTNNRWNWGKGNCSMGADIVSNSWGGGQGSDWYDDIIKSWQSVDMIPVFSMGNSGPNCGTANSPGDRPGVISVGSTEEDDTISTFSSLGPSVDGRMQPMISAPGGKVKSAWFLTDSSYNTISGTSMACPHVSGVVALMLQKNPNMKYDTVTKVITGSAAQDYLQTAEKSCGESDSSQYPNNVFGAGQIDALNAYNAS